jgi:Trp operon repressor
VRGEDQVPQLELLHYEEDLDDIINRVHWVERLVRGLIMRRLHMQVELDVGPDIARVGCGQQDFKVDPQSVLHILHQFLDSDGKIEIVNNLIKLEDRFINLLLATILTIEAGHDALGLLVQVICVSDYHRHKHGDRALEISVPIENHVIHHIPMRDGQTLPCLFIEYGESGN